MSSKEIMEDQGAKLRQILVSKESFKEAYLVRGRLVGREGGKGVRGEGGEVGGGAIGRAHV